MEPKIADPRRWMALAVLLTGTLLPPLDFFIVNVALPAIRTDLRASAGDSQLVVSVYAAAYAVTLILGGRLGDIYGRKRVFIFGMIGFGIASAVCGFAPSPAVLVAGRLLQGVAAAIMGPQSLASIHAIFPAEEKNRALSFYGATFGLASVAGQLLGGVLVSADLFGMGWRSVFLINLPVILLAIPAASFLLKENRAERSAILDIPGAVLLAAGLLAFILPLIEGRENHWPWWCRILLITSVPLLLAFWHYERNIESKGASSLIYPSLFMKSRLRKNLAAAFFFYALASFFLIFAVYEQGALGRDTLAIGLTILPLGVGFFLGPWCNPFIVSRLGSRTAAFGMIIEVIGLIFITVFSLKGSTSYLFLPLFLIGLGQGIAIPALVRLNVDQVDPRFSGLAAGLVSATFQISAAVFVALIGGLFFTLAPYGASAGEIQFAFGIATAAIGISLGVAAVLCWNDKRELT
ncbi:MFS transporter [Mucilaginibacter myungsuensis]|uniref:MFS transporter n=1 Tax=Mucilaginibacter myungsuensis TaxID=649104 RepID=A0A929KXM3_9SPHI|nr:MFS transporter [Mucilaginibacter myungsuensis]MBE9663057.1 MFS transporter [Mucilaginibacter myungsuensis]MDN3598691.1 MFS transporter [Mucilaginibacter myungsuensis]